MGLAFHEAILLKLFKFIEVYCGPETLIKRSKLPDYEIDEMSDSQESYLGCFLLFCIAFKHNLWLQNFEDFVKGQYFMKSDVLSLIKLLKILVISFLRLI